MPIEFKNGKEWEKLVSRDIFTCTGVIDLFLFNEKTVTSYIISAFYSGSGKTSCNQMVKCRTSGTQNRI